MQHTTLGADGRVSAAGGVIGLPRLDYGNATLVGLPAYQLHRLQSVMNAGARLIFRARKFDHVTDLLFNLHWLRAPERITYKVTVLMYQCLHGAAPGYLADDLHRVTDDVTRSRLRSASTSVLIIPRTRLSTIGDRSFPAADARIWNSVPVDVIATPSVSTVRSRLKIHLFRVSYP